MVPTSKNSVIKEHRIPILPLLFFLIAPIFCAWLFSDKEPYVELEVTYQPTTACIETHQTLNRNETQTPCGKIVSMK